MYSKDKALNCLCAQKTGRWSKRARGDNQSAGQAVYKGEKKRRSGRPICFCLTVPAGRQTALTQDTQTARETAAEAPPEGWELRFSKSRNNKPYYFNRATNESVWERPPGPPAAAKMSSGGPAQVRVAHLLVKHTGSRRPSSWRCPTVTLSKDEALARLRGFEAQIRSGAATLQQIAQTESDCSSAQRGGDLGLFARGAMQKPFEDASFALRVGELSSIVDTDSGVHLILRLE